MSDKSLRSALISAVLMVLLPAHASAGTVIERVVAVVNDDIVLASELERQTFVNNGGSVPDLGTEEGRKQWQTQERRTLDQMVGDVLIRQEAVNLKLSVTNEEVDRSIQQVRQQNNLDEPTFERAIEQQGFTMAGYRSELRRQILRYKVLNVAVGARVQVSEDEVRSYYNKTARLADADRNTLHLREILVGFRSEAEMAAAASRAAKIVQAAQLGHPFADLAKEYGEDDKTRQSGGDVGWVEISDLADNIRHVVAELPDGKVSSPIRTAEGFLIVFVQERRSNVKPYNEVKDALKRQIYEEQLTKATQSYINELKKKAHVDIRL